MSPSPPSFRIPPRRPCRACPLPALLLSLLAAAPAPARAAAEELDAVVARTVRSNYEALHGCYRRVLAQDRQRRGTLFVRVTLGAADGITRARLERDELKSDEFAACVMSWVRGWTLKGASAVGVEPGAEILLPLTFSAAPGQFAVSLEDTAEIGLSPRASARLLLTRANTGATRASLVQLEVKARLPLIGRPRVEQLLYVLAGKGALANTAARQRWPLASGSYAWIPADAHLSLQGELSLLQIFIPPGLEAELVPGRLPVSGAKVRWPVVGRARDHRPLRGGRGKPRFTPLLPPAKQGHGRFYLGLIDAPPGAAVPIHSHHIAAEMVYILSGQGRAECGGVSRAVGARDALYLPLGIPHKLDVERRLRALQLFVPAGPEQRFRKTHRRKKQ